MYDLSMKLRKMNHYKLIYEVGNCDSYEIVMNQYEIRKQIQRENGNKLFSEMGLVLFLIVIILTIIFVGKLPNPFRVVTVNDGNEIIEEYNNGLDYVKVKNASLEFTGYYKEDSDGNVRYYCYSTLIGDNKFFVFVPVSRTGDNPEVIFSLWDKCTLKQ